MIEPLNLVMTYPVSWSRYETLRDFVQNFYDAVGYPNWKDGFVYSYKDGTLELSAPGISFSYEWLTHIGASTKRDDVCAGFFGEGFKIASLCALRDFGWGVTMESADWRIEVLAVEKTIDGRTMGMLAYDIGRREFEDGSKLILTNVSEWDRGKFGLALASFYYPENPLMGKKIYEGSTCAVYERSSEPYRVGLPITEDFGEKGAVFCGYQLLGTNPFGLVVCQHDYRRTDRDRRALYGFNVVDVFENVACRLDGPAAMRVLEKMRRYWNSVPRRHIDIHSWSGAVRTLVRRAAEDEETRQRFVSKYPHLLVQKPAETLREQNRRAEARAWMRGEETDFRLAQSAFSAFGYPTLEEACEKAGGFVADDLPNELENAAFRVLEEVVEKLYSDFFDLSGGFPKRRVIRNGGAAYHGMATTFKRKARENEYGLRMRTRIGHIYLKYTVFAVESFYDAAATYVHEMCHAFGGDSSKSFSLALTQAMEILLANPQTIAEGRRQWEAVFR